MNAALGFERVYSSGASAMARRRRNPLPLMAFCALVPAACEDAAAPAAAPSATWPCPAAWVPSAFGGCGPAAVLCAPDGGGAPDACAAVPAGAPLIALPDGGIAGRWREPDALGGAPAATWRPAAGFVACPAGWALDGDGVCMPTEPRCEALSEALPGASCVPRASASCDGAVPAEVPAGAAIVRVRTGASAEGADGSSERPFATIARALQAAPPDAWVLVAPGAYVERVAVADRAVHLRGACWERTEIRAPSDVEDRGAVAVSGAAGWLDLGDVTVVGAHGGLWVTAGASLRAARVRVERSAHAGVYVGGAATRAELDDVLVRDVAPNEADANGQGVRVDGGASLALRDVAVVRPTRIGVEAVGAGTSIEGERVLVRDVRARGDNAVPHMGLRAIQGASVRLRGAVVRGAYLAGVGAFHAGSRVALDSALVAGVVANGGGAYGLYADAGGAITARRAVLRDGAGQGAYASGEGASFTLEDATVLGHGAPGAYAIDGASLALARVALVGNVGMGVGAYRGARASLDGVVVRATRATPNGRTGRGVEAFYGAILTARGLLVDGVREAGVLASGAGSRITLTDAVVRGTLPRASGEGGVGLFAADGAALDATRVRLEESRESALVAQAGAVTFRDGLILDTRPSVRGGRSVAVGFGGQATVERSVLQGAVEFGAFALGAGSSLTLRDVAVRDVAPRAHDEGGGWGVGAFHGGRVVAEGLLVERASRAGVIAYADDARVELRDAVVRDTRGAGSGFGAGALAADRGHLDIARVALVGAGGAGVVATAYAGRDAVVYGATVRAADLFVRGVRASGVDDQSPRAPLVAYGLAVGRDCALEAERATVLDADWGFFHNAGSLTLRRALVAGQRRGAGAANLVDARHPLVVEAVSLRGNASDAVARDIDLPSLQLVPPPEPELPTFAE